MSQLKLMRLNLAAAAARRNDGELDAKEVGTLLRMAEAGGVSADDVRWASRLRDDVERGRVRGDVRAVSPLLAAFVQKHAHRTRPEPGATVSTNRYRNGSFEVDARYVCKRDVSLVPPEAVVEAIRRGTHSLGTSMANYSRDQATGVVSFDFRPFYFASVGLARIRLDAPRTEGDSIVVPMTFRDGSSFLGNARFCVRVIEAADGKRHVEIREVWDAVRANPDKWQAAAGKVPALVHEYGMLRAPRRGFRGMEAAAGRIAADER